jgi:hypothetical protein
MGFDRSIGGSSGSRGVSATSQGFSRASGLSGTRGAYQPASSWGNGAPRGRRDEPREEKGTTPARFPALGGNKS